MREQKRFALARRMAQELANVQRRSARRRTLKDHIAFFDWRATAFPSLAGTGDEPEVRARWVARGVYFIQSGTDGPIKIGYAASVPKRQASKNQMTLVSAMPSRDTPQRR